MIPTVMLENIRAKKTDKFEDSQDKVENNQPLIQKMTNIHAGVELHFFPGE